MVWCNGDAGLAELLPARMRKARYDGDDGEAAPRVRLDVSRSLGKDPTQWAVRMLRMRKRNETEL